MRAYGAQHPVTTVPKTTGPTVTGPISGVPDVTGVGNTHGTISLEQVELDNPGTTARAVVFPYGGLSRGYLVVEPIISAGPLPLIVVLGGVDASTTQEAERDEFLPLVQARQAIVVYPAGYAESWNIGVAGCCGAAAAANVDDTGFVRAVTVAAQASLPVTTTYLVGFSNGGKLAFQAMCNSPELYAAIAVVAASPLTACPGQVPKPMFVAAGANDHDLPLQTKTEPVATVFAGALATWRGYDGCTTETTTVAVSTAVQTTWTACADGTRVSGVMYGGLDHEWPTTLLVGDQVNGAKLIWAFLLDAPWD